MKTIAIVGVVGVPAAYGGFETLADNLLKFHRDDHRKARFIVYCSGKSYRQRLTSYLGAELRYLPLRANGASSVLYDLMALFAAVRERVDVILVLGVSGAIALPLVRLFSRTRIVTNIDGIEWKREKWAGLARAFLRLSEHIAVRFSHEVIGDNAGIAEHVTQCYGGHCNVIAYGGDHALAVPAKAYEGSALPSGYALALCRIEPENNVAMILEAFARRPGLPLAFVGNWGNSAYGRKLRQFYARFDHLYLLDPIYDLGVLRTLRRDAVIYVHGHSAGGTNPSLVEMMHFGVPILAYDCVFNRRTTDDKAIWFNDSTSLVRAVCAFSKGEMENVGAEMQRLARERYTWRAIGEAYFKVLHGNSP